MDETTDPTTGTAAPPPPGPAPHDAPRVDWEHLKDVNRLHRSSDRMVAGVATGLARHFNLDPLVLRVAFAVLAFFGGAGILLYAALWLLLPEDGKAEAPIHLDERSRSVALVGLTALACLALLGDTWGLYWFPWPLAVIAVVVWIVVAQRRTKAEPVAQFGPQAAAAYDPAAYAAQAAYAPAPYAQQPPVPTPPITRPRDPRRRGPILFWFTLALIVLAMGVLGTIDLAGVAVADSAYPALAMTISAAMLLLGAFWGRAGGIILLALMAGTATIGAMANEHWEADRLVFEPTTASQVRDSYQLEGGELTLDLTSVEDLSALEGRSLTVEGGAGQITVLLPQRLAADVDAEIGGPGSIEFGGQPSQGGIAQSGSASFGRTGDPAIDLDLSLGVGEIRVEVREP